MIIKPMAIIRCPYCHAIIDENDKYCNNCGTQLLFTEDETVEEEIPGEKIIDADVEEKDYTVDEPGDEKRPAAAKDLDTGIDEDLERELREETEEMALDELVAEGTGGEAGDEVTEEVILVDEIAASEAKAEDGSPDLAKEDTAEPKKAGEEAEEEDDEEEEEEEKEEEKDKDEEDEKEDDEDEETDEKGDEKDKGKDEDKDEEEEEDSDEDEEIEEEDIAKEPAKAEEPEKADDTTTEIPEPLGASGEVAEVEYIVETPETDIASIAGGSALRPLTFDTRELESIGETVELGKEKVDSFVAAEAEADTEPKPEPPAPPQAAEKAPTGEPPTGTLPPWASTMKGAPVFPEDTGPVETRKIQGGEPGTLETEDEVEIFPRRKVSDSTMGLPERISQSPLPFDRTPTGEVPGEEGEDDAAADTGEAAEGVTTEAVAPPAEPARPARQPIFPVREPEPREPARPRIEALDESREPEPRPPFSFSAFFKSKAFDVLFVGIFWLVALWLAAGSMGMTLFEILGSMSGSMLLLYAVFAFLYFFLFKFFLGETLGDRLFRPRE